MAIRKMYKGGFTLVELMIVVAIVGVLAVLAVYGVRKYIANAKTAEAKNSLGQIGKDAVTAFEGERMASAVLTAGSSTAVLRAMCPTGTEGGVPKNDTDIKGMKYQSKKADWSLPADVTTNAGWPCLKFEMTAPQYYRYLYSAVGTNADGATFAASARGDLNGDGTMAVFTLNGAIEEGRLKLAPTIDEVNPEE